MALGYVPTRTLEETLDRSAQAIQTSLDRLDESRRSIESSRDHLHVHELPRCPRCSQPLVDFDAITADGDDLVHQRCVANGDRGVLWG